MSAPDTTLLPAHVLAREIAAGRLSPVDVTQAAIARIKAEDGRLHAFVATYFDEALLAAQGAEKAIRAGQPVGPLHGVPVALKDLADLEGRITTGGTKAWRARKSVATATVARKVMQAGMIILGKTHTVEFAFGGWGTNEHMGTPWNPWDRATHRVPGGSSSGSGVAVAARMVPWALGTDTGGSVRLPSAFCGLTGLKTTIGRISTHGILPLSPTLDTPGPIARTVEDAALFYDVMRGPDPLDRLTLGLPEDEPARALRRGVRGLHLARIPAAAREGVDGEILAAYDAALELLAKAGARIGTIEMPEGFGRYVEATSLIMQAECYAINHALLDDPAAPLDPAVRARALGGAGISARAYIAALGERAALKAAFAKAMAGFDALLTPTTATPAVPVADVDQAISPAHFTRFANLLELCALALPNGFTRGGLPVSLQIVCRGYEESMALRIGWAYQAASDWHERVPA